MERRRFDSDPGTAHPERNRGVPAGIWLEFSEQAGMKIKMKMTSFHPSFLTGMVCSGWMAGTTWN